MCIICTYYNQNKITVEEAKRHLKEMRPMLDEAHANTLEKSFGIKKKEDVCEDPEKTDQMWMFDLGNAWD